MWYYNNITQQLHVDQETLGEVIVPGLRCTRAVRVECRYKKHLVWEVEDLIGEDGGRWPR